MIGLRHYPGYYFAPTRLNPADDPTRQRQIRKNRLTPGFRRLRRVTILKVSIGGWLCRCSSGACRHGRGSTSGSLSPSRRFRGPGGEHLRRRGAEVQPLRVRVSLSWQQVQFQSFWGVSLLLAALAGLAAVCVGPPRDFPWEAVLRMFFWLDLSFFAFRGFPGEGPPRGRPQKLPLHSWPAVRPDQGRLVSEKTRLRGKTCFPPWTFSSLESWGIHREELVEGL